METTREHVRDMIISSVLPNLIANVRVYICERARVCVHMRHVQDAKVVRISR